MDAEYLLIVGLLSVSLLLVLFTCLRIANSSAVQAAGFVALGLGFPLVTSVALYVYREPRPMTDPVTFRPIEVESDGYVGSDSCRSCHPHQHATWAASYHRSMTQVASRETIIPPMDDAQFESDGAEFSLMWQGDQLLASLDVPRGGPDGNELIRLKSPVVLTTGSHHMQLFWYPLRSDTRLLAMFPYVFLREEQRWIPRGAAFLQPDFGLSDEVGRWNQTCIACHTTFGRTRPTLKKDPASRNWQPDPFDPDSFVAEFGISCEACHGPGDLHTRVNQNPIHRYRLHLTGNSDPTIVNPADLPHRLQSQVCGQCHSVQSIDAMEDWWISGFPYRPGDDLEQSDMRTILRVGHKASEASLQRMLDEDPAFVVDHFWSDGMVRISGREYNGLLESPCFQRGELSCLSCHRMHQHLGDSRSLDQWANDQLDAGMDGHQACTKCHARFSDEQTVVDHTHHLSQSAGSDCYNCHMPHTTYGLLKAIRSHQIDSPSVSVSLQTGRPNACNQCHLDKSLAWTSRYLSDWYKVPSPTLTEDQRTIAASILWLLRGDAGQRALMAWSYGRREAQAASGTKWMAPYLAQLLKDPYAAVRFIAARSLATLNEHRALDYDFLGGEGHFEAVRREVFQQWQASWNPGSLQGESLLIDRSGRLRMDQLQRLLQERDDTPITLVE